MTEHSHYLKDDDALIRAAAQWRAAGVVGLDTEFIRTRTFYPIPALYQVATADAVYLVDPLAIDVWQPFAELLTDPAVIKVVHACSEDLEVFARHLDVQPQGLFDTQVAVGFLGSDFSPSYAAVVERYTSTTVAKGATRSDWLARPLSEEQLHYAREDVAHLLHLHEALLHDLEAAGRRDWFVEENRRRTGANGVEPDAYYRTLRKAWRFTPRQLARLKALCAWRERRARRRDIPRQRVMRDEHLLALAAREDIDRDVVFAETPTPVAKRFWRDLVEAAESADALPDAQLPAPLEPPLSQREAETVKRLRKLAHEVARDLGVAEELLGRRRDVEACFRHFAVHGELDALHRGWRYEIVGERFESVLAERHA